MDSIYRGMFLDDFYPIGHIADEFSEMPDQIKRELMDGFRAHYFGDGWDGMRSHADLNRLFTNWFDTHAPDAILHYLNDLRIERRALSVEDRLK